MLQRALRMRQLLQLVTAPLQKTGARFVGNQHPGATLDVRHIYLPAIVDGGVHLAELIRRPQIDYACLAEFDKDRPELPFDVVEKAEIEIKYAGYIKKQLAQANELRRLERRLIPDNINYSEITGLRLEAAEKLEKIRPASIGQAVGISGVNPADITVLLIWLDKNGKK